MLLKKHRRQLTGGAAFPTVGILTTSADAAILSNEVGVLSHLEKVDKEGRLKMQLKTSFGTFTSAEELKENVKDHAGQELKNGKIENILFMAFLK